MKKIDFSVLKKYKWEALVSSIVALLPMVVGFIMWNSLPDKMPMHFGADGAADGFGYKGMVIVLIPLIILLLHWVCMLSMFLSAKNKNQDKAIMRVAIWIMPSIGLLVNGALYSVAFNKTMSMGSYIIPIVIAFMFIFMGNVLPKAVQNRTFGIKLPWTLDNEENWNKTHRFTGKVWVLGGIAIIFMLLLPDDVMIISAMVVLTLAVLLPCIYSYALYKSQLRRGVAEPISLTAMSKVTLAFCFLVLVGVMVLMFTGSVKVITGDDSFTVDASYWKDITVEYDDIESIEYVEDFDNGTRINGWGSARLGLGYFENEEFGVYTRYGYAYTDSAVVLTDADNEVLVINSKNDTATKALYEELAAKINK